MKSALPPLPDAAAGGLEVELGGEPGDCASAPDTISAPIAAPIISFLVMNRLLVRAMELLAIPGADMAARSGPTASENSCSVNFLQFTADEGPAFCIAGWPGLIGPAKARGGKKSLSLRGV